MNSRERIRRAVSHQEADRIPIDIGGISRGMHKEAYRNLLDYIGKKDEIKVYDPIQQLAYISEEVLDFLGADTRYIFPSTPFPFKSPFVCPQYFSADDKVKEYADGWGTVNKSSGKYYDVSRPVLSGLSFEEIKKYKFPDPLDPDRFKDIRKEAMKLYNETGNALIHTHG